MPTSDGAEAGESARSSLSFCAATQPETALHLNFKFYLREQLQSASELWVEQSCAAGCQKMRRVVLVHSWDEVRIECQLDRFRLDVALLQQGQVIGALEVVVTHAIDAAKIEYLDRHQIRWFELSANENFYEGPSAWTPKQPLPVDEVQLADRPWWQTWVCPACREEKQRQKREEQERIEMGKLTRQKLAATKIRFAEIKRDQVPTETAINFRSQVRAARSIEVTFRSGKFLREIFYIVQEFDAEEPSRVLLQSGFKIKTTLAQLPGAMTPEKMQELKQFVENWCAQQKSRGADVNDSMSW